MEKSEPKYVTASALLSEVTDWARHEAYDGADLTAFDYTKFENRLTNVLRKAHQDGAAIAAPDEKVLSGYGTLVGKIIHDIAMIKEKTRRVIQAHIEAHAGDRSLMDHLGRVFEARERFADKHYGGGAQAIDSLHHLARVFEGNDKPVQARNKSSVVSSEAVRRGVLSPK